MSVILRELAKLLELSPTTLSRALAAGILQALQQLNLKVPKDISLICYDDLEIAKTNNPPLTVMCPQAINAGERLVGMLIEIFNGCPIEDLQEIWKVEMVQRQSTGRV